MNFVQFVHLTLSFSLYLLQLNHARSQPILNSLLKGYNIINFSFHPVENVHIRVFQFLDPRTWARCAYVCLINVFLQNGHIALLSSLVATNKLFLKLHTFLFVPWEYRNQLLLVFILVILNLYHSEHLFLQRTVIWQQSFEKLKSLLEDVLVLFKICLQSLEILWLKVKYFFVLRKKVLVLMLLYLSFQKLLLTI